MIKYICMLALLCPLAFGQVARTRPMNASEKAAFCAATDAAIGFVQRWFEKKEAEPVQDAAALARIRRVLNQLIDARKRKMTGELGIFVSTVTPGAQFGEVDGFDGIFVGPYHWKSLGWDTSTEVVGGQSPYNLYAACPPLHVQHIIANEMHHAQYGDFNAWRAVCDWAGWDAGTNAFQRQIGRIAWLACDELESHLASLTVVEAALEDTSPAQPSVVDVDLALGGLEADQTEDFNRSESVISVLDDLSSIITLPSGLAVMRIKLLVKRFQITSLRLSIESRNRAR